MSSTTNRGLEPIKTDILPDVLPFSSAVKANGFVFVSGQIGHIRGQLKVVEGGIEAETRQAMTYMREVLEKSGSSMDHVVKCTAFLADLKDFTAFNAVYRSFFTKHLPARSSFEVKALALGARMEIECIAVVP